MIIGITINNIIRDEISQMIKAYETITDKEHISPVNPFNLELSFPTIKSDVITEEFNPDVELPEQLHLNEVDLDFNIYKFIYEEASFEIFGRAYESEDGIIRKLKQYEKKLGVKFILINKESPRSKGATLFFLSKNNFDFEKILFPKNEKGFWDEVDVLITDNPKVLKRKPKNKYSIKVQNDFNIDIKSDFTIINLSDIKTLKNIIKEIKNKN
jgi:hypothetical protein